MTEFSPSIRVPLVTIKPGAGMAALNLREIWHFRELLGGLAGRDVRLRYRQTALGAIWVVLQPLMAAGIFSFVFGSVAKLPSGGLPYFLFAYTGLLGWNAFSSTLTKASGCLVGNANLVSKVFFPRLILPFSTILSTVIDFVIALSVMIPLMIVYDIRPSFGIALLPIWFSLLVLLATGLGLIAAALMVTYRDVQFILPVFVQMLLYASPVAYSVSVVPDKMRTLYFLNPLSGLLEAFRWSLLGAGEMPWAYVSYSALITIVIFFVGAFTFKRMERKFADVI